MSATGPFIRNKQTLVEADYTSLRCQEQKQEGLFDHLIGAAAALASDPAEPVTRKIGDDIGAAAACAIEGRRSGGVEDVACPLSLPAAQHRLGVAL